MKKFKLLITYTNCFKMLTFLFLAFALLFLGLNIFNYVTGTEVTETSILGDAIGLFFFTIMVASSHKIGWTTDPLFVVATYFRDQPTTHQELYFLSNGKIKYRYDEMDNVSKIPTAQMITIDELSGVGFEMAYGNLTNQYPRRVGQGNHKWIKKVIEGCK